MLPPREYDELHLPQALNDVVTCELHTTVGGLRDEVARSPYGFALVIGPDAVLLGACTTRRCKTIATRPRKTSCDPGPQ